MLHGRMNYRQIEIDTTTALVDDQIEIGGNELVYVGPANGPVIQVRLSDVQNDAITLHPGEALALAFDEFYISSPASLVKPVLACSFDSSKVIQTLNKPVIREFTRTFSVNTTFDLDLSDYNIQSADVWCSRDNVLTNPRLSFDGTDFSHHARFQIFDAFGVDWPTALGGAFLTTTQYIHVYVMAAKKLRFVCTNVTGPTTLYIRCVESAGNVIMGGSVHISNTSLPIAMVGTQTAGFIFPPGGSVVLYVGTNGGGNAWINIGTGFTNGVFTFADSDGKPVTVYEQKTGNPLRTVINPGSYFVPTSGLGLIYINATIGFGNSLVQASVLPFGSTTTTTIRPRDQSNGYINVSAVNDAVKVTDLGAFDNSLDAGTVVFDIFDDPVFGPWIGQIDFEAETFQGTWRNIKAWNSVGGAWVLNTAANGVFQIPMSGFKDVRCRMTVAGGGFAAIGWSYAHGTFYPG